MNVKHYAYYNDGTLYINAFTISNSAEYYLIPSTKGRYLVYIDSYYRKGPARTFGLIGAIATNKTRASILDLTTDVLVEVDDDLMNHLLKDNIYLRDLYNHSDKEVRDVIFIINSLNATMTKKEKQ